MRHAIDVKDRKSGHVAVLNLYQHVIKPHVRIGGCGRLTWEDITPITRSGMRRSFHGFMLKEFSLHTGHSQAEMKAWLTWKFCPAQFDADDQLVGDYEKSTEAMSDSQFAQFLSEVRAFGEGFLHMVFPEPPSQPPAKILAITNERDT